MKEAYTHTHTHTHLQVDTRYPSKIYEEENIDVTYTDNCTLTASSIEGRDTLTHPQSGVAWIRFFSFSFSFSPKVPVTTPVPPLTPTPLLPNITPPPVPNLRSNVLCISCTTSRA